VPKGTGLLHCPARSDEAAARRRGHLCYAARLQMLARTADDSYRRGRRDEEAHPSRDRRPHRPTGDRLAPIGRRKDSMRVRTCCFPGCDASAIHRCENCGGHFCVEHVRDYGRYLLCLTCEPEPVRIPLGAGCRVRVLKGGASVYGDPDARAQKLMFLNPGAEVEAIEEVGGFYHVLAGEGEGYIPRLSTKLAGARAQEKTSLWWRRVGATLIDWLVMWAIYFVVVLLARAGKFHTSDPTSGADTGLVLLNLAASLPYWWLTHGIGRSAGKLLLGLRIVDKSGLTPNFQTALVRSGMSFVSCFPCAWGYWWASLDNSGQTIHDKVAGTYVVRMGRVSAEDAPAATELSAVTSAQRTGKPSLASDQDQGKSPAKALGMSAAPSRQQTGVRGEVLPPGTSAFERPDRASAKLFKFPAGLVLDVTKEEQGFYEIAVFGTDRRVYVPMDALSSGVDKARTVNEGGAA